MLKEIILLTKNNKIKILISYIGLIFLFLIYFEFNIPCLFKNIFHIPCPSCGMTRAFKLIITLNIIESFHYNILALPLFLTIIIIFILNIIDIIFIKNNINKFINLIIKNYYLIIILLLISWIINIYRGI